MWNHIFDFEMGFIKNLILGMALGICLLFGFVIWFDGTAMMNHLTAPIPSMTRNQNDGGMESLDNPCAGGCTYYLSDSGEEE